MKVHIDSNYQKLSYGDHVCLLYKNNDEYRYVAINYIREGIMNNEKVVCVLHEYSKETLIQDLKNIHIDVDNLIKSKQLVIRSINDVYWKDSGFNPNETLDYWEMKKRAFKEEGFPAMRVMAEMIFSVYDEYGMTKLIEYEMLSNKSNLENQIHLCIFNKEEFPSFVLEEMIQSHNVLIQGKNIVKPNPYHVDYSDQLKTHEKKKLMRNELDLCSNYNMSPIYTDSIRRNRDANILKHVLGSVGDGIWEWNVQSDEVYLNEGFFNILGYKQNQISIKASKLNKLIHPKDLYGFKNQFKKYFNNKIEYIDYEIRVKSKNGQWTWIRVRGTSIQTDEVHKEVVKMAGIYIDIREKKHISEELDKRNHLEKSNIDFISNISHELRTPMNVILGSLQLQDFYIKNDKTSEYISKYNKINKRMKQNSYRLLRLLNNVIDATKIESGFYNINLENYDIKMLIEKIVASIDDYVSNSGLNIKFKCNTEKLIIACDPEKIEKILLNLLSNAIKFTEPGGNIAVNLIATDEVVSIHIKDSGIGIPEDKLERIFDRFKQVNSLKHRANEGSGIGLSLVRSWVTAHEGEISVRSKEDKGTEFIIKLPNRSVIGSKSSTNEVAATSDINVERLNIEFSDIYL